MKKGFLKLFRNNCILADYVQKYTIYIRLEKRIECIVFFSYFINRF